MLQDTGTFVDLLDQSYDAIPEEVILPAAVYRLRATRAVGFKAKPAEDKAAAAMFVYEILEAGPEADLAKLAAIGGKMALKSVEILRNFQLKKPYDLQRLNKHIEMHGVKLSKGMTRDDAIKGCKGTEIMAFVQPRSWTNKDGVEVTVNDPSEFFAV